jgi:hypothetical protein
VSGGASLLLPAQLLQSVFLLPRNEWRNIMKSEINDRNLTTAMYCRNCKENSTHLLEALGVDIKRADSAGYPLCYQWKCSECSEVTEKYDCITRFDFTFWTYDENGRR